MKIQAAKNAVDWVKLYNKKKDTLWLHFTAKALEEFYDVDHNWWESEYFIFLPPFDYAFGVEEQVFHDLINFPK